MKKAKRYFNTSGPNIPEEHYTLMRPDLIAKGKEMVEQKRYFTIWAPRQTGKSTYFRLLAADLTKLGYKVAHINVESFLQAPLHSLFEYLLDEIKRHWGKEWKCETLSDLFNEIKGLNDGRYVLIVDEVEHLNPDYFGQFLHT
ncbi:MAG: ATP-binding protein, partial [Bacteroidetes bacterium]|nr:ATP-binding protein [Bacteroidota bacterium]